MFTMAQWCNWRRLFSRRREKIEISVETKESWEIRWTNRSNKQLCPFCQIETLFLPVDEIALMLRVELRFVEKLLNQENVHFLITKENEYLICVDSVRQQICIFRQRKREKN